MPTQREGREVSTEIPARMDRLPWSSWHWVVIAGLGTVWVLDGLEVTIVGAIGARLQEDGALGLTASQVGYASTLYLVGAGLGALFWGYLTDRLGRKRLFMLTLAMYLLATVATAFAPSFAFFAVCRFLTGFGLGGEYAAINSAVDELIPARARGWVDLAINGSYWLGAAFGAALTGILLDTAIFGEDLGWRLAFGLGAVLGIGILLVRRNVPESPRWMVIHGQEREAERLVDGIEREVLERTGKAELEALGDDVAITVRQRRSTGFVEVARTILARYRRRAFLGFTLLATQAFIYNAVTFPFSSILTGFFDAKESTAGLYLVPFGIANFIGALALGRLFDTLGRRRMISGTYLVAAVGLAVTAVLVGQEALGTWGFVGLLCLTFFFASAAASAGYLTVSETFPLETRAMAIALFYALSTGIGGAVGPLIFGRIADSGDATQLMWGFLGAAVLMAFAAGTEAVLGVDAEGKSLEQIAEPLSAEAAG